MKILVTGGYGFIGSNFIMKILDRYKDFQIINIDSKTYASNHKILKHFYKYKNYQYYNVDISSFPKVYNIINKYKPNLIVNFAAETHVDNSINSPNSFINTNIIGTYNLLESSNKILNFKKNKFLFIQISTDEVYGDLEKSKRKFTEDSNLKPSSPYSSSKASADLLCLSYYRTYKMPVIVSRCTNNYGPYQHPEKLIPKVIINLINNKKIPIYNKGNEIRDWIYVEDHINAIINLIFKSKIGQIYNVGSNNTQSNINLVKKIISIYNIENKKNIKFNQVIKFVKDRPGHDYKYAINNKKIINEIKWKPEKKFTKGLRDTINWYIKNDKKNY